MYFPDSAGGEVNGCSPHTSSFSPAYESYHVTVKPRHVTLISTRQL